MRDTEHTDKRVLRVLRAIDAIEKAEAELRAAIADARRDEPAFAQRPGGIEQHHTSAGLSIRALEEATGKSRSWISN
jgi:hypothetical protein